MTTSIIIKDTYAAIQRLQEKGASKDLAEEIVATVSAAKVESDPATQADLLRLEGALRSELYRALLIHGFVTVTAVIGSAITLGSFLGIVA
ncbi:MAG: hypothetical protein AAFQ64_20055 [Pseudomonadota bacterium]